MRHPDLTSTRLAAMRALLEDRLGRLRSELDVALHAAGESTPASLPNRREETDDDAVADLLTEIDAAQVERDGGEAVQVEEALERLRAGSFGFCVDCGEPIAWARLRAVPHASRCRECAEGAELRRGDAARPRL